MKKHLLTTTAAGAAMALSAPAMAEGYVSIFGGISMSDQKASWSDSFLRTYEYLGTTNTFNRTTTGTVTKSEGAASWEEFTAFFTKTRHTTKSATFSSTNLDFSTDNGFVIGAAFGKEIADGLRGEIELAYRKQDVDVAGTAYSGSFYYTRFASQAFGAYIGHWLSQPYTEAYTYSDTKFYTKFTNGAFFSQYTTTGTNTTIDLSGSGDISAVSIMANVWLDVDLGLGGNVHPYVGAGVGFADVTLDVGGIDVSDSAVAFQVGMGASFDLPNTGHSIGVEVRRFVVPKLELEHEGVELPLDYETTDIIVSYRINF